MSDPPRTSDYPALRSQLLEGEHPLRHEVVGLGDRFEAVSVDAALTFLETFAQGITGPCAWSLFDPTAKASFDNWGRLGWKLLSASPTSSDLCREYFTSSSEFLAVTSAEDLANAFRHIPTWVHLALQVDESSHEAALEFFRSTPAFVEARGISYVTQWAGTTLQILRTGASRQAAAISYLRSSPRMHRFLANMGFAEWKAAGLLMATHSADLGSAFFEAWPEGMSSLHQSDVRSLMRVVTLVGASSPTQALDFYQSSPAAVARLNPNIRDSLITTALTLSDSEPEKVLAAFADITSALLPLSNPAQESVMTLGAPIAELSLEASAAYYRNVGSVLSEIPEAFLPAWVGSGLSLIAEDEQTGTNFFSLQVAEARRELLRWKEAELLEDHKQLLSIFARALSGQEMRVKGTDELERQEESRPGQYTAADGHTIWLPPWFAEEPTRKANFRLYKVATAHHAGYLEFGTSAEGLSTICSLLELLPHGELARDIFFILEDGRIDRRLKQAYRGLAVEMDLALSAAMGRRSYPQGDPLGQALEVLLRLSVDRFDRAEPAAELSAYAQFLEAALVGFYDSARHVWDTLRKATEIHRVLRELATTETYCRIHPLPFWERPDPELLPGSSVPSELPDEIDEVVQGRPLVSIPLSPEELEELLEELKDLQSLRNPDEELTSRGLYITGSGIEADDDGLTPDGDKPYNRDHPIPLDLSRPAHQRGPFYYDEWDYLQRDYRRRWCCLREEQISSRDSDLFEQIYDSYRDLIQKVKRQFQQIRPEVLEIVPRVDTGDEINLPALIQSVVDRRVGSEPSDKIFTRKERRIRRVSTLLLVDMSASTDQKVPVPDDPTGPHPGGDFVGDSRKTKRIIDIERESLVVITEALEALDDEYAVFGFSGQGRHKVDFYTIKEFDDPYSEELKRRISGIVPKQSTRMGPAIRHATEKLRSVESDHRLMILLSDGFPQDTDYGEDRASKEYALNDTMMALLEARREGIRPFCLTVDEAGNDYLRSMCDPHSYLVIKDIHSLPEVLPDVVESLMI
jgi:nitric oxide reductase NorD protein